MLLELNCKTLWTIISQHIVSAYYPYLTGIKVEKKLLKRYLTAFGSLFCLPLSVSIKSDFDFQSNDREGDCPPHQ